jgi:LysR family transcriptional activator of nhaA
MEWLNYHHLLYFYLVAKEGTIAKAGQVLRLAQPTISGQIRALEEALGEKLFVRSGRTLQLTETGQIVYRYAEEIFALGKELQDTLKGRPSGRPLRLHVGISDVVPKLIAYRLLEPALRGNMNVQVVCTEDKTERLLADLSTHGLDLVLVDSPITPGSRVRAFNHLLGECGLSFFARKDMAGRLESGFPRSLDGEPMLLPTENTVMRRQLDRWFEANSVRPRIVAEFADSALMKVFGERGEGVFPGPSVIEKEIREHYNVALVGRAPDLRERYYAITVERRIKNPAVQAISDAARDQVFRA